jgi:UDP-N-acetyl-2-amino-2-deoxyglucuronate dehydrogenase
MKNFIIIGAAGYIAPRHMKAIKDTGNNLIAAFDPHDGVGILDKYFPEVKFFNQFERMDRYLNKIINEGCKIDYVSICSPNHLHDYYIRYGLGIGANVICEKPTVLNTWNIDSLHEYEKRSNNKIFNILQLRLHPSIISLKNSISTKSNKVELKYITSRGSWYSTSWKGEITKSGGLATNIGIHFFDMLNWIFGPYDSLENIKCSSKTISGSMKLKNADVDWLLSIDKKLLPKNYINSSQNFFRSILINGNEIEFSKGFDDLHTTSYEEILNGRGFTLNDVKPSIEIVSKIREHEKRI